MKRTLLDFLLCSLMAFGAGLVSELLLLGSLSFFVHSSALYYFLRSLFVAAALPFCLYLVCFKKNKRFRHFYESCGNGLADPDEAGKRYLRENAKYLAVILLVSVVILTVVPKSWSAATGDEANALSLYGDLVNLLISSSALFAEHLPKLIFGVDTWWLRLCGALLWSGYFVLSYYLAMTATLRAWYKRGIEGGKKINVRRLLVIGGMVFQLEVVLVLAVDLIVSGMQGDAGGTSSWSKMLWSLLLITVFELLYLIEAILALLRERSKFGIFKLCLVAASAILLTSLMYYTTVGTVFCLALLAAVFVVECISLSRFKTESDE